MHGAMLDDSHRTHADCYYLVAARVRVRAWDSSVLMRGWTAGTRE